MQEKYNGIGYANTIFFLFHTRFQTSRLSPHTIQIELKCHPSSSNLRNEILNANGRNHSFIVDSAEAGGPCHKSRYEYVRKK